MAKEAAIEITAELVYRDPERALEWLAQAFGFQTRMIVNDEAGKIVFAETGWAEQTVAIVPEQADLLASPLDTNGLNTQIVRFRSDADIDEHCARAKAAGARIVWGPETLFFGDRSYQAVDIEGHIWSFNQRITGSATRPPEGWRIQFPSRNDGPEG